MASGAAPRQPQKGMLPGRGVRDKLERVFRLWFVVMKLSSKMSGVNAYRVHPLNCLPRRGEEEEHGYGRAGEEGLGYEEVLP